MSREGPTVLEADGRRDEGNHYRTPPRDRPPGARDRDDGRRPRNRDRPAQRQHRRRPCPRSDQHRGATTGLRRPDAYQTMMAVRLDLFTLPLTELLVAATRLGESPRLRTHLDQAEHLLAALHEPPLWTVNLRWAQLHAAVLRDDREAAGTAASELGRHTNTSRYADVMARAARTWTEVIAGAIEPVEVTAVADDLYALGLHGEAERLAAHAATRTPDRAATVTLLETARRVRGGEGVAEPGATNTTALLSDREVEVARLVATGMTYKQIGARLYISGKTVEHHVAKVRTKLGATDRRELLRMLHDMFSG